MSKSNEKLVQNTLKILERDFIVVGKTRVRSWHAWLAIGIAAGAVASILFVANRSGEFEAGMAASWGTATAKSYISGLAPSNAIDGNLSNFYSSKKQSSANSNQWISIAISPSKIHKVRILPRIANGKVLAFSVNFSLQYSVNGGQSFTDIPGQTFTNYIAGSDWQDFFFDAISGVTNIKLNATKLGTDDFNNYFLQLSEIILQGPGMNQYTEGVKVFDRSNAWDYSPAVMSFVNDPLKAHIFYSSTDFNSMGLEADAVYYGVYDIKSKSVINNAAKVLGASENIKNAKITASSFLSGWEPEKAQDGNRGTAYSSNMHTSSDSTEWLKVSFPPSLVQRIEIHPRLYGTGTLGFTKDFKLQYSKDNGVTFTDIHSLNNWEAKADWQSFPIVETEGLKNVTDIRLLATKLNPDDYGNYYLQIEEMLVFGGWDTMHVGDPAVVSGKFSYGGNIYNYAMYYTGTHHILNQSKIGAAFSNDLTNWKKYPYPVIRPSTESDYFYGDGMPSVVNLDGNSKLIIFYTDISPRSSASGDPLRLFLFRTTDDGIHFSAAKKISRNGLPDIMTLDAPMISSDYATGKWYMAVGSNNPVQKCTKPNPIYDHMEVKVYRTDNLETGVWKYVDTLDYSIANNMDHNPAFLTDVFGNITSFKTQLPTFFGRGGCGIDDIKGWSLWMATGSF